MPYQFAYIIGDGVVAEAGTVITTNLDLRRSAGKSHCLSPVERITPRRSLRNN
jgi:hypothetical protein